MKRLSGWTIALAVAFAASLNPARAEITGGSGEIEIYAGWYWPDDGPGISLDDLTFGVRGGINFTPAFGLLIGAGYWEGSEGVTLATVPPASFKAKAEQWHGDISLVWNINPDSRSVFQFFGGPGYAETDVTNWALVGGAAVKGTASKGTWTGHAGFGVRIACTDTFYIRPEGRVRYFDDVPGGNGERWDYEASIGFGWALGQ